MKYPTDVEVLNLAASGKLRVLPIDQLPEEAKKHMFKSLSFIGKQNFENSILCLLLIEDDQRTSWLSLKKPLFCNYLLAELANHQAELLERTLLNLEDLSLLNSQLDELVLMKEHPIHQKAQDYSEQLKVYHPDYWS